MKSHLEIRRVLRRIGLLGTGLVVISAFAAVIAIGNENSKTAAPRADGKIEKTVIGVEAKPQVTIAPTASESIAKAIADIDQINESRRIVAYRLLAAEGEHAREPLNRALGKLTGLEVRVQTMRQLLKEIDAQKDLPPVDVKFRVRGYCIAGSAIHDPDALGGFGPSDNLPRQITPGDPIDRPQSGEVYLLARPEEIAPFGVNKYQGFALYLVNGTNQRRTFDACNSMVSILREAKDETGTWREIEYLPRSWCGNSYHHVLIDPAQAWRFIAPKYAGPLKTTMRFRMTVATRGAQQGATAVSTTIYSNEFDGAINPEQFTAKQGHKPTDIMDPYLE